MPLTDVEIRAAKAKERPYKLGDGDWLFVRVMPSGSKLWRMGFRHAGKENELALGAYPQLSLKAAREARDAAKALLAKGINPNERKRLDRLIKAESDAITFRRVSEDLLSKVTREGQAEITLAKKRWLLDMALPDLGNRPIAEITAPEVLAVLQAVEDKGHYETARRLRSTIGQVFRFAISTGRASNDPTFPLRGALVTPTPKNHAAIVDPAKLGEFLRALDGYQTWNPPTKAAMRLLILTLARPGEIRMAKWAEFDFDAAIWSIPAPNTKKRREHRIHLSRQAIAVLRELHPLTSHSQYVFPAVSKPSRSLSENTLVGALRRMGLTKEEVTAHGFRTTASTLLHESGKFQSDVIERALSHVEKNTVKRAYDRSQHWDERLRMLNWWGDYLDQLKASAKAAPMTGRMMPA